MPNSLLNKELKKVESKKAHRVSVPFSKSISNRLLVLKALLKGNLDIKNLSNGDDTVIMRKVLDSAFNCTIIDVKNAGTCYRFLTAYNALNADEVILKGSEEMTKRPIKILVDALRELGAEINYLGNEGYPPLRIVGTKLNGGTVSVNGGVSSQYITALLLIAPFFKEALTINVIGDFKSKSYVMMTVNLLKQIGVEVTLTEENTITVSPLINQTETTISVEPDWSSASYWYQYVSFLPLGESLLIRGLKAKSIQGDVIIKNLYSHFGVTTEFTMEGAILKKESKTNTAVFKHNFESTPDIVQTLVLTCVGEGVNGVFEGISHLKHKETDRILALTKEIKKLNYALTMLSDDSFKIEKQDLLPQKAIIATYNDHRMAMSFAPLVLKMDSIEIENPNVVDKSYPGFWEYI
jgi:3-phosphoshikimate 1-carboxyvinyltransferase